MFVLSILNVRRERKLDLSWKSAVWRNCFIFKWNNWSRRLSTTFRQEVWTSRTLTLKGIYQGLFAHSKCFFIHHMATFWFLCFWEVTKLTGSRGKIIRLWTLFWCKTLSNSTEIYNLVKDACKHIPYPPIRKTKNCTMKANFVCLLSEFLGVAMYQEGQWAIGKIPGFGLTPSDHIKNLKLQ